VELEDVEHEVVQLHHEDLLKRHQAVPTVLLLKVSCLDQIKMILSLGTE
jgi:hypothetical protein